MTGKAPKPEWYRALRGLIVIVGAIVVIVVIAMGSGSKKARPRHPQTAGQNKAQAIQGQQTADRTAIGQCETLEFSTAALCKTEFANAYDDYSLGSGQGYTGRDIVAAMPQLVRRCEQHHSPYRCGQQLGQALQIAYRADNP